MRIELLTFLRFVAAAIVVLFHFGKKTSLVAPSPGFLTAGPEMVSFFFVLSGFVLVVSHWRRAEEPLWRFYWARVTRIAPAYYVALVAAQLLRPTHDMSLLTAHAFIVQAWLLDMPTRLNAAAWSISVELFFYAIFPFVLSLVRLPRWRSTTLLAASLAAWAMTEVVVVYLENARVTAPYHGILHDGVYYFPLVHLSSFLLGATGAAFHLATDHARPRDRLASSLLAAVSLSVTYLALELRTKWCHVDGVFVPTSAGLLSPLFLWVILALARTDGPLARFFSRKPFRVLGEASYAVYILQFPVRFAYERYLMPATPRLRPNDFASTGHFLRFAGILLVLSIASAYLFEKPVRRLLSRLVSEVRPRPLVELDPSS